MNGNKVLTYNEFLKFLSLTNENLLKKIDDQNYNTNYLLTESILKKLLDNDSIENNQYLKLIYAILIYKIIYEFENISFENLSYQINKIKKIDKELLLENIPENIKQILDIINKNVDTDFNYNTFLIEKISLIANKSPENIWKEITLENLTLTPKDNKEESKENISKYKKNYKNDYNNYKNLKNILNLKLTTSSIQEQIIEIESKLNWNVFDAKKTTREIIKNVEKEKRYLINFDQILENDYFESYTNNQGIMGFKLKDDKTLPKGIYKFNFNFNLKFENIKELNTNNEKIVFNIEMYYTESDFKNKSFMNKIENGIDIYLFGNNQYISDTQTIIIEVENDLSTAYLGISLNSENFSNYDLTLLENWNLKVTSPNINLLTNHDKKEHSHSDLENKIRNNTEDIKEITKLLQDQIDVNDNNIANLQTELIELEMNYNENNNQILQNQITILQTQVDNLNQLIINRELPTGTMIINKNNESINNGGFTYGTWELMEKIGNESNFILKLKDNDLYIWIRKK